MGFSHLGAFLAYVTLPLGDVPAPCHNEEEGQIVIPSPCGHSEAASEGWQSHDSEDSEWLRPRAAARVCSVPQSRIYTWIYSGKVEIRRQGRSLLIRREALLKQANPQPHGSVKGPRTAPRSQGPSQPEMSMGEVVQWSGCSVKAVYRAVQNGQLTRRTVSGRLVFDSTEVGAWLERERHLAAETPDSQQQWWTLKAISTAHNMSTGWLQRQITRGHLRAVLFPVKSTPTWMVEEKDLQAWLRSLDSKLTTSLPEGGKLDHLQGEVLSLRAAARRYHVGQQTLQMAAAAGALPISCQRQRGPLRYLVGSRDVETLLRARTQEKGWSCLRVAALTGIDVKKLRAAVRDGRLRAQGHGTDWRLQESDIAEWLQRERPAYRREVAQLSPLVTPQEVAQLAQIGPENVQAAIRDGNLPTLDGMLPRRVVDDWLAGRGLPPSWESDRPSEWLITEDAARLCGVSVLSIRSWVRGGHVETQRLGSFILVRREALLRYAGKAPPSGSMTVREATRRYQISRNILQKAVHRGAIPHTKRGKSHALFVLAADVEAWLQRRGDVWPLPRQPIGKPMPAPALDREAYFLSDAARLGRVNYHTLSLAIREGKLKATRSSRGGPYIIMRLDLQRWLDALFALRGGMTTPRLEEPPTSQPTLPPATDKAPSGACKPARSRPKLGGADPAPPSRPGLLSPPVEPGQVSVPATQQPEARVPRGQVLDIERACRRYGCHYDVLASAVERGMIAATKEFSDGKFHWQMGSLDIEEYLRQHDEEKPALTSKSIAEMTGIPVRTVFRAIATGQVVADRSGTVSPTSLALWLENAPAYRPEVEPLSRVLSSKEVGRISKLGQTAVVKAIRARQLQALALEAPTGIRYCIPRMCLDVWLAGRGLPPSWQLEGDR